jgi:hypothetical protein
LYGIDGITADLGVGAPPATAPPIVLLLSV